MKAKKTNQTARELRIEYIPLTELKKWPRNPKLHDLPMLTKSFARFGFINPIILNEATGELLAGHGRLDILLEAKAQKKPLPDGVKSSNGDWLVPVVRGISLEGKEAEAYAIADNRLVEIGGWQDDLLAEVLQGIDLEGIGYSQADLDELLANLIEPKAGLTDDDEIPEKVETVCKTDDFWQLGEHRLLCGDATKKEDVERLMGGEKADAILTDPPYGIHIMTDYGFGKRGKRAVNGKTFKPIVGNEKEFEPSFLLALADTLVLWGANHYAHKLPHNGQWLVWDKREDKIPERNQADCELAWCSKYKAARIFRHYWDGMLKASERGEQRVHPTQKPIALILWCIEQINSPRIILDPFGGSGSTLIACEKLGRKCYMMEIDPYYGDIIIQRWQNFTGQKAVKLNA